MSHTEPKRRDLETLLLRIRDISHINTNSKKLVILLGLLGDLDSFEYVEAIINILPRLKRSRINLVFIAIGDQHSKRKFCSFTKLPSQLLEVEEDASLHQLLGLSPGLVNFFHPLFNLILMCLGFHSPGTIKEVLRGYTGDKTSSQLFKSEDTIHIGIFPDFKAKLFDERLGTGYLRPFEMATKRLINMREILSNWSIYMKNDQFLTNRGGTFLISEDDNVIYSYKPKSLLSYSSTMNTPTTFLKPYLDNTEP